MSKQTAVEWLATYLKGVTFLNCDEVIEQAKAMQREQMIDFAQMWQDSPIEKYDCKEDLYNETYKGGNKPQDLAFLVGAVSGSFSRLNEWFDMNSEPSYLGKQLNENLYNDIEAKRLCVKLAKELIDSVRQNDFHFKNMSTVEVLEYLLK